MLKKSIETRETLTQTRLEIKPVGTQVFKILNAFSPTVLQLLDFFVHLIGKSILINIKEGS